MPTNATIFRSYTLALSALICASLSFVGGMQLGNIQKTLKISVTGMQAATAEFGNASSTTLVPYIGRVHHIFFHSLMVYPALALRGKSGLPFGENMVTASEFKKILDELYARDYVLIDIHSLYRKKADGSISPRVLMLPPGKKPLILSLDDLNYYPRMRGHGFADKLVLDSGGNVATAVVVPNASTTITRDGDVVPILDDFVAAHRDFSMHGAKGIIAETGFAGVLGWRTQNASSTKYSAERAGAETVVARLKATGWQFASHSYTHEPSFRDGTISLAELERDTELWKERVEPIVGRTDIFIGPFGQVFKASDPRREYLLSQGFDALCGVGMDNYFHYFSTYLDMNRADIDGYRLMVTPQLLTPYFDPTQVIDPARTAPGAAKYTKVY